MYSVKTLDEANDMLRQILERLPTARERFEQEERRAWDMYAAADSVGRPDASQAANAVQADAILAERRKRFPPPEHE